MIVLGIDPSLTATGVIVLDTAKHKGWWLEHRDVLSSKYKGVDRVVDLGQSLESVIVEHRPDVAVIEGYGFSSINLAPSVEVGFMYRYTCWNLSIPLLVVPPTSLKQFVTGKGNAKKEEVMREVYRVWGFSGTNDETDAYGLAMFGCAALGALRLPESHMKPITKWKLGHAELLKSIATGLRPVDERS